MITYNDIYEDETENWKAQYVLKEAHIFVTANRKIHYYGEDKSKLILTYKGNISELSPSGEFNYHYDTGSKGSSGSRVSLNKNNKYVQRSHSITSSIPRSRNNFTDPLSSFNLLSLKRNKYTYPMGSADSVPKTSHKFMDPMSSVFKPYKVIFISHEACGGTDIGKNDTINVTVMFGEQIETLELRSSS